MKREEFVSKTVRVGERGQIVIPKPIRIREKIKPRDVLKVTSIAGTITIKKVEVKSPEEKVFEFIENSGLSMKDWKDIQKERDRER